MDFRIFAHSWLSDWNHGNAHFLRGLARELTRRGHRVRAYESLAGGEGGWSLNHLRQEPRGWAAIRQMRRGFAHLDLRFYDAGPGSASAWADELGCPRVDDWATELDGAEWVIVHEWNPPALLNDMLRWRARLGFRLLFHDTHHRALTQPDALRRLPLSQLDGVLAFGESLRRVYERWGVRHSYTLHEAADLEHFHPAETASRPLWDVAWIGNWGDEERTREIDDFLLGPVASLGLRSCAFGVRYPESARVRLARAGLTYGGYLPNLDAAYLYHHSRLSIHIPRQAYRASLAGIPTIRVFEALACGAALVSAPWPDSEGLFHPGQDYAVAATPGEMAVLMKQLLSDETQRMQLGRQGAAAIAARHSCAHRARELEAICRDVA